MSLNDIDSEGETALHYAVKSGTADMVKTLLEAGAQVNFKTTEYNFTPLHYALIRSRDDIVASLLNHGANPNDEDYAGVTPLQYARDLHTNPDLIKKMEEAIESLSLACI